MRGLNETVSVVRSTETDDSGVGVKRTEGTIISSLRARCVLEAYPWRLERFGREGRRDWTVSTAVASVAIRRGDVIVRSDGGRLEVDSVEDAKDADGEVDHWLIHASDTV